jgi:hypothetical protein
MHRYIVERSFPERFGLRSDSDGAKVCRAVIGVNAEEGVTWVHSYFSEDGTKSYCVYDAPGPEAIREVARKNNLPVDRITEVRVLDPYFWR